LRVRSARGWSFDGIGGSVRQETTLNFTPLSTDRYAPLKFTRKFLTLGAVMACGLGISLADPIPSSAASSPFKHPSAIALDDHGDLWVGNQDYFGLTEINARTGKVVRIIDARADGFIDPSDIAVKGNEVWVVSGGVTYQNGTSHVGTVTELNASTGALIRTVSLKKHGITGLAALSIDGNDVWVVADGGSRIAELSAATGKVLFIHRDRPRYAASSGIAALGDHVWIASPEISSGVVERSAVTGRKVRTITPEYAETPPGGGTPGQTVLGPQYVAADPRYVWTANQGSLSVKLVAGSVTQINAASGKIVRTIDTAADHFYGTINSIVSDGTHVWIANGTDGYKGRRHGDTVTELNATNGSLVRVIHIHNTIYSDPVGLVTNGVDVWIADQGGGIGTYGSVIELNAATGAVVRVIP
jgi:hypothetical protein